MCRIHEGASGVLSSDLNNVVIHCSHSLLNDTGIALGSDGITLPQLQQAQIGGV